MRIEGLYASFSPSFEPLTDCPLTDTQRYCDILLLPPLLFELPCSFASFFSPIGFLWCSHTSYFTTSLLPLAEISKFEVGIKAPSEMKNALSKEVKAFVATAC